jgi:hypothetical protein
MREVLPIGLLIVKASGLLLVGIGLVVLVFATHQVDPWPMAGVGTSIAGMGGGLLLIALRVRTSSLRYQCPSCKRVFQADAVKCPHCGVWFIP